MLRRVKKELPIDQAPVVATFTGIREHLDEDGVVKGFWFCTEEFQDMYINNNVQNPENNFELFNLADQLGLEEYDDEKVAEYFNPKSGTKVFVSRVTRKEYTNVHFALPQEKPAKSTRKLK